MAQEAVPSSEPPVTNARPHRRRASADFSIVPPALRLTHHSIVDNGKRSQVLYIRWRLEHAPILMRKRRTRFITLQQRPCWTTGRLLGRNHLQGTGRSWLETSGGQFPVVQRNAHRCGTGKNSRTMGSDCATGLLQVHSLEYYPHASRLTWRRSSLCNP